VRGKKEEKSQSLKKEKVWGERTLGRVYLSWGLLKRTGWRSARTSMNINREKIRRE